MREYNSDKNINNITNSIWHIYNSFRGVLDNKDFDVVLLLLSLYKDGLLDQTINNYYNNIQNLLVDRLFASSKYDAIATVYKPTLNSIPRKVIEILVHELQYFNRETLNEYFPEIFDDLLYKFSKAQGRISGEFIQPIELTRFILSLANLRADSKIFNPFAGLASFGVYLDKTQDYFGQELDQKTWALGTLRLLANNKPSSTQYNCADSINNWPSRNETFDLVVAHPPFSMRLGRVYRDLNPNIKTTEQFLIEKGLESLSPIGKLITILPLGFLFRGGYDLQLRRKLVQLDVLDTIISLPGGLLANTGIPFVILLLNYNKKESGMVRFVDASAFIDLNGTKDKVLNDYLLNELLKYNNDKSDAIRFISNEQIIANDYNLSVPRYLESKVILAENENLVKLRDIIEPFRGQRTNLPEKGKLIRIRDLKDENVDFFLDYEVVEETVLNRHNIYQIDESCLLLGLRWKTLKPTFFEFKGNPIFKTHDIFSAKVNQSRIDIAYLINELQSEYVLKQLDSYRLGAAIPFIRQDDLLEVIIKLPSLEEQKAKIEGIKQAYIQSKRKELAYQQELLGLKDESFREFASIKHTLRQYLNALKSNVAGTRMFVQNNQEIGVTLDTIYSKNLNKTFGEHLSGLEGTISSMSKLLSSFETSNENQLIVECNLIKLVEEAQNRFKNTESFQFEKVHFDRESFTLGDGSVLKPIISISEDDFYRIFSNIISNALDHGFKDSSKKYFIRTSISYDENENLCILEVSNNGRAMPKEFTLKYLTTRGEKTTNSKGTGMGGSDIKNILRKYNGILDLTNEETEDFAVTYIIKIPLLTIT